MVTRITGTRRREGEEPAARLSVIDLVATVADVTSDEREPMLEVARLLSTRVRRAPRERESGR